MGSQRVSHDWVTFTFTSLHIIYIYIYIYIFPICWGYANTCECSRRRDLRQHLVPGWLQTRPSSSNFQDMQIHIILWNCNYVLNWNCNYIVNISDAQVPEMEMCQPPEPVLPNHQNYMPIVLIIINPIGFQSQVFWGPPSGPGHKNWGAWWGHKPLAPQG